jgi:hypothetical protein
VIRRKSVGFFSTPKEAKEHASKMVFIEIERLSTERDSSHEVSKIAISSNNDKVDMPIPPSTNQNFTTPSLPAGRILQQTKTPSHPPHHLGEQRSRGSYLTHHPSRPSRGQQHFQPYQQQSSYHHQMPPPFIRAFPLYSFHVQPMQYFGPYLPVGMWGLPIPQNYHTTLCNRPRPPYTGVKVRVVVDDMLDEKELEEGKRKNGGDVESNAKRCKREELEKNDDEQTLDGSQVSMNGDQDILSSNSSKKYSDIVSSRSKVVWEEHQEPNWGRFVYSCRVTLVGGARVFVGKRLFKDLVEAKEDLAFDVVKSLYHKALL